MVDVLLSEAERTYTLHGVQDNLREDGRGCEDYRHMEIETTAVSNSTGSARLRLANTEILVGIKADLGSPLPERPNAGRLEFFVDCSANATPQFEGRGGKELATAISNMLMNAYDNPDCLNLESLCVIPEEQCWVVYIDVVLLECGGNLFDASSVAVKAALYNTKFPTVIVTEEDNGQKEVSISDDPYNVQRLDVSNCPCITTLSKIGHHHAVDASQKEEDCSLARLMIGVTEKGTICSLKMEGSGSLDPESMYDMLESGKRVGQALNINLMKVLKDEERLGPIKEKVGFLR